MPRVRWFLARGTSLFRVNPVRWSFNSFLQNIRREHCQIYELNLGAWSEKTSTVIQAGSNFSSSSECLMYLKRKESTLRTILVLFSSYFPPSFLSEGASRGKAKQFLNHVTEAYVIAQDWIGKVAIVLRDHKKILRFELKCGQCWGSSVIQIR